MAETETEATSVHLFSLQLRSAGPSHSDSCSLFYPQMLIPDVAMPPFSSHCPSSEPCPSKPAGSSLWQLGKGRKSMGDT
ncbi:uncharacterized protein SETTUDRAFT_166670 [Exserohilum turcica Et28A]|uniref:Uncharacterized protein n=1 Tax=Exserohilum turcicum (strain 28A) TaxID=671987 RepID=R0KSJ8_EXST2|nr:uncharacterized protein SETTUDRAFT_166670 [Exserohilum turcica Et28A]EOA90767.1 hypothetical protein SETTUDRAFT_166670 [Exserohilum turcica Et28A]